MAPELGQDLPVGAAELGVDEVHRRAADEAGHEQVRRIVVERLGGADLLELALSHQRYTVAERHRLDLIVSDVDGRHSELALELADLGPHLGSKLRIEIREWLVHEERLRLTDDGAAHRHALPLTAGQLSRLPRQLLLEVEHACNPLYALLDLVFGKVAELEREGEIVEDGLVRVERVVLEDHRDVALARREVGDHPIPDRDVPRRRVLEPGHHAQGGRLPAAGRPDEDHQLTVRNLEAEVQDGLRTVRKGLAEVL